MMKILYVKNDFETLMNQWQDYYIIGELENAGITVEKLVPNKFNSVEHANEALVCKVRGNHYDLFICLYNEQTIFPETVEEISRCGIPTVLLCFDNLLIPFEFKKICRHYDYVWLTAKDNEGSFRKWGANTIFLPYAASPIICKPENVESINRIAFIGSPYGSRIQLINGLIDSGLPLDLFYDQQKGNTVYKRQGIREDIHAFVGLSKSHIGRLSIYSAIRQRIQKPQLHAFDGEQTRVFPSVSITNQGTVYSAYSLCLASTALRNTGILNNPIPIVNLRAFEIPMCGGVEFCQYIPELAGYFEDGQEIVFYHSEEEKEEKAHYYLHPQHTNEIQRIRKNARRRAECEHTWMNRFSSLFQVIGLKP